MEEWKEGKWETRRKYKKEKMFREARERTARKGIPGRKGKDEKMQENGRKQMKGGLRRMEEWEEEKTEN